MTTTSHTQPGQIDKTWHARATFGLHFDLHAKSWECGHGRDLHAEDLHVLIRATQPDFVQCDCKGHEGLTTWPTTTGTSAPDLAQDSLAVYREVTRTYNIPLVVHYSGVWDEEAIRQHPDWAAIDATGAPHRLATCRTHGYDRDLLHPQLVEILQHYDVDGIWVDGENWAATPCWCNRCTDEFRRRTAYAGDIPRVPEHPWHHRWIDFHRDLFREHVHAYAAAVRRVKPSCTVVSNWMHTLRQPDPAPFEIDYLSGDFHYAFGIEEALPEAAFLDTRGISWDLMIWAFTMNGAQPGGRTLKQPLQLQQEAATILSRGGTVALYDQPARTGRHLTWHTELLADISAFCRRRRDIPIGRSAAEMLVLLNPAHHYRTSPALFAYSPATTAIRGAAYALQELHVPFDIATLDDDIDLQRYRTVVVPEQGDLDAVSDRLRAYAEAGGHLVLTGPEAFTARLSPSRSAAMDTEWAFVSTTGDQTTPLPGPWPVAPITPQTLLTAQPDDFDPGWQPSPGFSAVERLTIGSGAVTVAAGPVFGGYHQTRYPRTREVIRVVLDNGDTDPLIMTDDVPWMHLSVREASDTTVVHVTDVSSGQPLSPRNVSVEGPITSSPFRFNLRWPSSSLTVEVQPSGAAEVSVTPDDNGRIRVTVTELQVHCAIVLRADQTDHADLQ